MPFAGSSSPPVSINGFAMCQIGLQLKAMHIRFLRSPRAVKVTLAAMLFGMPAAEASAPAFCAGPDTTILSLTTEVGDHVELEMTRYKDETKCPTYCLRAGVKFISKDGKLAQRAWQLATRLFPNPDIKISSVNAAPPWLTSLQLRE